MNIKKIYFVGIKGVGMSPLAILAKQAGFVVAGSDINEAFITDEYLSRENIFPLRGFSEKNIENFIAKSFKDEILVISTSAHNGFNNIETKFARENKFKVLTQGQAVGSFMSGEILDRHDLEGISIAGTHGKTTISALFATTLSILEFNPSYVVGTGEIFPLGAPGHYGKGSVFVAEADEYVSEPNFDPVPKFLYQMPKFAVFNNIDFDHPDYYKNLEAVENAFIEFSGKIKKSGILFINGDSQRINSVRERMNSGIKVVTYGVSEKNDFSITNFKEAGTGSRFSVETKGITLGEFDLSIPGFHNAKNSLPVIALLLEFGVSVSKIKQALLKFLGTKRRLETIGKINGNIIIDDYAHHPNEIKATLSAIKKAYPGKKVICIFQPHTYSRTKALLFDFVASFFDADFLILLPIYASLREKKDVNFSSKDLLDGFRKIRRDVLLLNEKKIVLEYISQNFKSGDCIIVTMGAGDVYKISQELKVKS
ncbi:MAG: UDP-N-acetylmuramate--L-alanine ligase [Candidatus Levybacteria bacterium RIFCSPHIGHO2_01_FULL_36_15]|nr:MAG: UDP-N-acetylmuramate--L-alanine ligase [Candidatus Levybacteria bacterium RIFCSPHIGHO2_01_FULL_36_15]OGH37948.1 MAG: UDP-N-acetylmuramate--L-alanine ligase [Candidatus Levybacteria bacterium RIFCSPLOWO2_01_FULL_36_10]